MKLPVDKIAKLVDYHDADKFAEEFKACNPEYSEVVPLWFIRAIFSKALPEPIPEWQLCGLYLATNLIQEEPKVARGLCKTNYAHLGYVTRCTYLDTLARLDDEIVKGAPRDDGLRLIGLIVDEGKGDNL